MLLIDFETKSECNLITRGAYIYAKHSTTDVLCAVVGRIDSDAAPVRWAPGDAVPEVVKDNIGLVCASNATFDRLIWQHVMTKKYGWPAMARERWYCTQAEARVNGLPSRLEDCAYALQLDINKNPRGHALIKKMSIPPFEHTPELLQEMLDYCERDWIVTALCHQRMTKLSDELQADYVANEEINDRGFCIDCELAVAALEYRAIEQEECTQLLRTLTNNAVTQHTQRERFSKWLINELDDTRALAIMKVYKDGKEKISIDKTTRANLLENAEELQIPANVVKAIECYDIASGTATAKYEKLLNLCDEDDGRVRGVFRAFGAPSTLRYSSLGVQMHNMYRDTFDDEHVETIREKVINKQPLTDPISGKKLAVTETLSKLLRSTIIAEPGKVLVSADWSAIESRVTAWLADDQDKLDVFRRGECPYCYAAEQIYGYKITKEENPDERQVGKVTDLACGFLGGAGALRAMSANLSVDIADEKLEILVHAWRAKHTKIVSFGNALQAAAENAMRRPHVPQQCGRVTYIYDTSALRVVLADNSTVLTYADARLEYNSDTQRVEITSLKASFKKKQDDTEWPRHSLWRGLLLENVVQATCAILCRDVAYTFAEYIVLHIHDEIVLEVDEAHADVFKAELETEMCAERGWATGLPLHAEARVSKRFGK